MSLNTIPEIWKDIKGYEGLYQVSNLGNVRSLMFVNGTTFKPRIRLLKQQIRNNYYIINLCKNGKRKQHSVHRLVAQEFLENKQNKEVVNHLDFNKLNNKVENLEWCTQKENVSHSLCNMKGKRHFNKDKVYGVSFRKRINKYELVIDKKYRGTFVTLEEAIKERDRILNEINI